MDTRHLLGRRFPTTILALLLLPILISCGPSCDTTTPAPPMLGPCNDILREGVTGPIEPPNIWHDLLAHECYDVLISEVKSVIPEDAYFAEAQLYMGMALLAQDAAPPDFILCLRFAEENLPDLITVDPIAEQILLYRGQMILYAQLADEYDRDDFRAKAEEYQEKAVSLASPSQADLIRIEFYQRTYDNDIRP